MTPGRKRICFVTASPLTVRAFLRDQIATLARAHDVTVITHLDDGERLDALEGMARVLSVPIEREVTPLADLRCLWRLLRVFRRERFDIVHTVTPKAGLLAMLAGFLSRVPVRVHIFTGQVWLTRRGVARWFLKLMDRAIAGCATHILVDSPSQRDFLLAEGVLSADKSRVLSKGSISGVDASRFKPDPQARSDVRARLGYRDDMVVFLYLGRLHRDKGVLDLAAAFSRLAARDERPRLLLVGPDEDDIEAVIRAALGDTALQARFVGYTDRPEQHMAAADVFCLPSYREGFGTAVIEAAASGIPAIGSRIYGITDAIEENVTGLLFQSGDVEALAGCMMRLAADTALRRALGERARARALQDFRSDLITLELMRFYASALGQIKG